MNVVRLSKSGSLPEVLLPRSDAPSFGDPNLLGGSWVVFGRVISRVAILIPLLRGLITPLKKRKHAP